MGMFLAIILFIVFMIGVIILYFVPIPTWIKAFSAGVHVSFGDFIGMRLRNVSPDKIIDQFIMLERAGIHIKRQELEAHYLAGGNITAVSLALIEAHKAGIPLHFAQAAAIDLAGRNVLEAVSMSINPKVIKTPLIEAVAKDGIQVRATARITVRANIERLIGGAGEETVVARVGEGVVTTIGSAETHKKVLENPNMITQNVLRRGLDRGTAFEILSIDIADVDIGRNIGAQIQIEQANADKLIAQAHAESRRAEAIATEEEMKARVEEMRVKVIEAECQVPLGLANALREGRLGLGNSKSTSQLPGKTPAGQITSSYQSV